MEHPSVKRRFKLEAKLHFYLALKKPSVFSIQNRVYTLFSILFNLRSIIQEEKLYDERNESLIIADELLDEVLGAKYVHQSNLKSMVDTQLEVMDAKKFYCKSPPLPPSPPRKLVVPLILMGYTCPKCPF